MFNPDQTYDMLDAFPAKKRPDPKSMTARQRVLYCEMVAAFEDVTLCSGCLEELDDPVWCHCGEHVSNHAGQEEHSFVPAGCTCHYTYGSIVVNRKTTE